MDQRERTEDRREALRAAIDGALAEVWTAMPGVVESYNPAQCTCVVQVATQARVRKAGGEIVWMSIPPLQDVPVVFPGGGGFVLSFGIQPGDEVLVIFASRCIDAWWQSGGTQNVQAEIRMHDLSDGFAIPRPFSVPSVPVNLDPTNAVLRTVDGNFFVRMSAGDLGSILIQKTFVANTFAPNFPAGSTIQVEIDPFGQVILNSSALGLSTSLGNLGSTIANSVIDPGSSQPRALDVTCEPSGTQDGAEAMRVTATGENKGNATVGIDVEVAATLQGGATDKDAIGIVVNISAGSGVRPIGVSAPNVLLQSTVFASLPSPAPLGMIACITDSTVNTWGTPAAGGGAFSVLVFFNGGSWTVFAK